MGTLGNGVGAWHSGGVARVQLRRSNSIYVGSPICDQPQFVEWIRRIVDLTSGKRAYGSDWSGGRHFGAAPRGGRDARAAESAGRRGSAGAKGARQSHQLEASGAHYLVIAAAVAGAVWMIEASRAGEVSWWWTVPATIVAIITIGASQHQFGGAIHEGTHYMLVANRKLNELASRLVRGFSYPDDNLSLPAAPPRAPSVRQRPRTRSGHQPAA